MSNIIISKYKGSKIPPKLKSQVLVEILSPNSSIPKIAKKHNLSSTTLYGWRSDYKKLNCESSDVAKNNFIELLPKESDNKSLLLPKSKDSKLSEISLMFNNISLSLKGNINTSSLIKILNALESC